MCGIAGRSAVTSLEANHARGLGESFSRAVQTRGPDASGFHHDRDVVVVHRRLSIVDLSEAGLQPMWNEDRTICVIVNGEIYNFQDLRHTLTRAGHRFRSRSDSEVIVHLYEERGIGGCCGALEGMFAFALWDSRTRDLYLVRDRLGIKPLAIAEHAGGVTFASTIGGLLADPDVPRDLRGEALTTVMRWGFVPTPWSALRCARHLVPGSYVRIREGRVVSEVVWWQDAPPSAPSTPGEVRAAIDDAVRSHLVADVPVGVLLSAGIDSGVVTALATRSCATGELEAWTASQRGFPEDEYADTVRTAQHLGIPLHEIPVGVVGATADTIAAVVDAMDEPLAVSSLVGLHALFRAISPDRRVVLSGDGGDELFAGYDWHIGMPLLPWWARSSLFRIAAPAVRRAFSSGGRLSATLDAAAVLARRHAGHVYLDKLEISSEEERGAMGLEWPADDPMLHRAVDIWDRFESAGTIEQMLAVDRGTALVDEMLAKVDTASMAYCIETRVPFLADPVVAKVKALPASEKRVGSEGKRLLREWFRELGPPGAAARPKTGFNSPVGAWFDGPAREYLRDHAAGGARLLGIRKPPRSPRLLFASAVLGAWSERHSGSPAATERLAS